MQRLFSSFARGWPGIGLLLMRVVAAAALTDQSLAALRNHLPGISFLLICFMFCIAGTILLGLWTPIAGLLALIVEIRLGFIHRPDIWIPLLVGTLVSALALIGPGALSVDARLFGWKRIDIEHRQK